MYLGFQLFFDEGVREDEASFLGGHVYPEAWRALAEQLQAFNLEHFDELEHFNFPFIYFTEKELEEHIINDQELYTKFLEHTEALENGQEAPLPFNACVGIGVPQIYMHANDKSPEGTGRLSACNIDTGAHHRYVANFNEQTGEYVLEDSNQIAGMMDSPHLCPAVHQATGGMHSTSSDRFATESGSLFHGCRFIGNNQMPMRLEEFPREVYDRYVAKYKAEFNSG